MMMIWVGIFFSWNIIGFFIIAICLSAMSNGAMGHANGMEFVNPVHVYKYNKVNWFGAILVATLYGLICPIGTLVYWLYKLCTVGRK